MPRLLAYIPSEGQGCKGRLEVSGVQISDKEPGEPGYPAADGKAMAKSGVGG